MITENQEMRIRCAREDELDQAGQIAVNAFSRLRNLLTPENWLKMEHGIYFTTAQDTLGTLLVATKSGKIVGSVRYTAPGHGGHIIYPNAYAYVRALAVSPNHLRYGIGKKLSEACIDAARKDQAKALGLHVATANKAARALYGKLGFQYLKEAPEYFGVMSESGVQLI